MPTTATRVALLLLVLSSVATPANRAAAATLVVANKAEATASLIDLDTGEVVVTVPTGEGPHEVGISPDGRFALISNYGRRGSAGESLTLIGVAAGAVVNTIELGDDRAPHGVEWLDERRAAVTVEGDRALAIVDVERGVVEEVIETGQDVSHMVALDPSRARAYVTNIGSGTLTVIDLAAGERVANVPTGEGAEGIAVAPGSGAVWVTNRAADTVSVLDPGSLEPLATLASPGFPIRATATPDGRILVTRARAGELVIYTAKDREVLRTVAFDLEALGGDGRLFGDRFGASSVPIGVVVDGVGEHAFVAHANADVVTEVDLRRGAVVRVLRAGREPDGMGWSPIDVAR